MLYSPDCSGTKKLINPQHYLYKEAISYFSKDDCRMLSLLEIFILKIFKILANLVNTEVLQQCISVQNPVVTVPTSLRLGAGAEALESIEYPVVIRPDQHAGELLLGFPIVSQSHVI